MLIGRRSAWSASRADPQRQTRRNTRGQALARLPANLCPSTVLPMTIVIIWCRTVLRTSQCKMTLLLKPLSMIAKVADTHQNSIWVPSRLQVAWVDQCCNLPAGAYTLTVVIGE